MSPLLFSPPAGRSAAVRGPGSRGVRARGYSGFPGGDKPLREEKGDARVLLCRLRRHSRANDSSRPGPQRGGEFNPGLELQQGRGPPGLPRERSRGAERAEGPAAPRCPGGAASRRLRAWILPTPPPRRALLSLGRSATRSARSSEHRECVGKSLLLGCGSGFRRRGRV